MWMGLHLLKVSVRLPGIKNLIIVHHRNQILRLAQIDNIMGIPRPHMNTLNLIPANLKLNHLIGTQLAFLNQSMTAYHNKEFPLSIMPMLLSSCFFSSRENMRISPISALRKRFKTALPKLPFRPLSAASCL